MTLKEQKGLELVRSKILPDFCISGRAMESVDGVVLHYFSCKNVDPDRIYDMHACRDLFLDLNLEKNERRRYMMADKWPDGRMYASAHLMIGRDGETWKLVEFDKQAYHAGASVMNGRSNCNRWTLGIELLGTNDSGFSREQYMALAEILRDLEGEYGIPRANIQGHDQVRHAAIEAGSDKRPKYDPSGRKDGQGDNFDWPYLGQLLDGQECTPNGVVDVEDLLPG